jgi:Fe-S cluster assembly ATPase SufC
MEKPEKLTPVDIWEDFIDLEDFREQAREIIPSSLEVGERRDILVVTGENASGKSLAFMIINQLGRSFAKQDDVNLEVMDIGMGRRTRSGMEKGFMFGDESTDSTGNISLRVMQTAVSNSRSRERFHFLMLDEPDIGVGEGYHNAIGRYLADYASELPDKCLGLVVATHSRRIAERLLEAGASSVRLGSDLRPVRDWIRDGDVEKTVDDLIGLKDVSLERFRAVVAMLKE